MKKFLSKLPVLISFAVATVLLLGMVIGFSVRPVSTGMTYSGKQTNEIQGATSVAEYTIKIKDNERLQYKLKVETTYNGVRIEEDCEDTDEECWYVREGNTMLILGSTEKNTKEEVDLDVESLKAAGLWDKALAGELDDVYAPIAVDVNAFGATAKYPAGPGTTLEYKATCVGNVVLVVILALLTAATATFTTLSVIYFVKDKKQPVAQA